jgi:hypothetical protein
MLTGIPCPLCGSTRSLAAWGQLDFAKAFAFNPLVASASAALCIWGVFWLINRAQAHLWVLRAGKLLRRCPWLIAGVVLANWVYLWMTLPK